MVKRKGGVTPAGFRRLALSMPETEEKSHMKHPDFRVRGKIFATLGYPDRDSGMVKLTPSEQKTFVTAEPEVFHPCSGVWGQRGATNVRLAAVNKKTLEDALLRAWRNVAGQDMR